MNRFSKYSPDKFGSLMVLIVAAFWGMFPIVVNKGTQYISPLFFAAISNLAGALTVCVLSFVKKDFRKIFQKEALLWGFLVAITMAAFPYSLIFLGAKLTSGVNTAAFLLSEIIFTIIITPFFGEKPTFNKTLGGLLVLAGAFIILFKGGSFNIGDVLIIFSTILYPFGNYCGKKAVQFISSENLLFIRYFIGGLCILALSFFFEHTNAMIPSLINYWPYVALNGILLLGFVNILWYKGLKLLPISKAVFLLMTYPLFSLLFLTVFYGERPNIFQITGIGIIVLGAYFTTKNRPLVKRPTGSLSIE